MCSRDGQQQEKDKSRSSSSKGRVAAANGDRVRDRNGYRQRAAAFCARLAIPADEEESMRGQPSAALLEVLLVSGRREGSAENYWVLPGGGVESMESTEEAVIRELKEEAGILGKILSFIGKFIDEQRLHHTTLYFLTVQETFDEWENCLNGRERRWMGMDEARRSIKANQLGMLEQSISVIERTLSKHSQDGILLAIEEAGTRSSCPPPPPPLHQHFLTTASNKSPPSMAKSASLD